MPETHTSAGVIPLVDPSSPSYLLLQYPQGHWGFPKGHLEENDKTLWEAAKRELHEETGLDVEKRFRDYRQVLDYWYTFDGDRHHKTVYFFAGSVSSRDVTLSEEHQNSGWYNEKNTLEQLTYNNEKELFRDWLEYYSRY